MKKQLSTQDALYQSVVTNDPDGIKAQIALGANPHHVDPRYGSLLRLASMIGVSNETLTELLAGRQPNGWDIDDLRSNHYSHLTHPHLVRSALHMAALEGHLHLVEQLLEHGASVTDAMLADTNIPQAIRSWLSKHRDGQVLTEAELDALWAIRAPAPLIDRLRGEREMAELMTLKPQSPTSPSADPRNVT